jgi:hypothetical protein
MPSNRESFGRLEVRPTLYSEIKTTFFRRWRLFTGGKHYSSSMQPHMVTRFETVYFMTEQSQFGQVKTNQRRAW